VKFRIYCTFIVNEFGANCVSFALIADRSSIFDMDFLLFVFARIELDAKCGASSIHCGITADELHRRVDIIRFNGNSRSLLVCEKGQNPG